MVDFLEQLPEVFRKRYLQTHSVYLKSMADIIATMYKTRNLRKASVNMVRKILTQGAKVDERREDPGHETLEFRNLRNCWYHECSLNYPFKNLDRRLKFASWKIIQCYYSVFASIASLVCCYHPPQKSPNKILNIYGREFLCSKERSKIFLPPVNLYLNQQGVIPRDLSEKITWEYAHEFKIPYIKKCLESVHKENACMHYHSTLSQIFERMGYISRCLSFVQTIR